MENKSGIYPVEYKCLVKMLPKEVQTKGGIFLPDKQQDRYHHAVEVGHFIAAGGNAFTDPKWSRDDIPKAGNKVIFDRYSGTIQKGIDGEEYRLLNDKEIGAIVEDSYGN